jgi:hypothetical protein
MTTPLSPASGRSRTIAGRLALLVIVLGLLAAPSNALGAPLQLSWSALIPIVPEEARPEAVSCPTTGLCVAVDLAGDVITSTNPTGGASAWTATRIDEAKDLESISCPTTAFCAATDFSGNIFTSTNPTGGASAWHGVNTGHHENLGSISCPTTGFCTALSLGSEVFTSTEPTGPAGAWHSAVVDTGNRLTGVDCPTTGLCVAVDAKGRVLTSTNPTGGASAWSAPVAVSAKINEVPLPLNHVSCPTVNFCALTDGLDAKTNDSPSSGNVIYSSNPTGGASTWTVSPFISWGLFAVDCPLVARCLANDDEHVYSLETAGVEATWLTSFSEPVEYFHNLIGLSCPSAELCVVVDTQGHVLTGTATEKTAAKEEKPVSKEPSPPTGSGGPSSGGSISGIGTAIFEINPAVLAASLGHVLAPSGRAAKIGALLKHGGLSMSFNALVAGTLVVDWWQVPPGARLARHTKARPVLVAVGQSICGGSGAGKVALHLTANGRKLLKHAQRLALTIQATFSPTGWAPVRTTKAMLLKR